MFQSNHEPGTALWCEAVSKYISDTVEDDSIVEYREPEPGRWHLGASEIGKPCSRAIWYSFRWFRKVEHTGRLLRLFRRGHSEEPKFVHRLERIGVKATDRDPDTGKQYQIAHPQEPHYGGSLDGIAYIPFIGLYVICEFKTHNDKSFEKLKAKGVRVSKPQHYQQMCAYGKVYGLKFGLYCAINKNTDDLYFKLVPLDWKFAEITDEKAIAIIRAHTAPRRISENSASQECKLCDYRGPCHLGQPAAVNCRSCHYATPNKQDKEWTCNHPSIGPAVIPRDVVIRGCQYYVTIQ